MNWITRWKKIGIKVKQIFKKQPMGQEETDWKNCPQCKKISYKPDLHDNAYICECSFHFDFPPKLRLKSLFDSEYETIDATDNINPDPLNFVVKNGAREGYKYIDKIKKINKSKNLVIGFGITSKNISAFKTADGCVVGSEICKKISESLKKRQNPVTNVANMVKKLRIKLL